MSESKNLGLGSTQTLGTDAVTDTLEIDFIGGVDAVGLDVFGFNAIVFAPMPVVLTLFGIDDTTAVETDAVIFDSGFTGSKFFGVESLDAVGSLRVTNPGVPGCCMPVIDNLTFGHTRPVPQPSAWLLVGIGFTGMAIARRIQSPPSPLWQPGGYIHGRGIFLLIRGSELADYTRSACG